MHMEKGEDLKDFFAKKRTDMRGSVSESKTSQFHSPRRFPRKTGDDVEKRGNNSHGKVQARRKQLGTITQLNETQNLNTPECRNTPTSNNVEGKLKSCESEPSARSRLRKSKGDDLKNFLAKKRSEVRQSKGELKDSFLLIVEPKGKSPGIKAHASNHKAKGQNTVRPESRKKDEQQRKDFVQEKTETKSSRSQQHHKGETVQVSVEKSSSVKKTADWSAIEAKNSNDMRTTSANNEQVSANRQSASPQKKRSLKFWQKRRRRSKTSVESNSSEKPRSSFFTGFRKDSGRKSSQDSKLAIG
mmetsp:Transcript_15371/g.17396  ORF Transcript_15371/g.17396 Transcript_15371/m.17396 type:complete len:301 (-) Transcript_15371:166-1068(-)